MENISIHNQRGGGKWLYLDSTEMKYIPCRLTYNTVLLLAMVQKFSSGLPLLFNGIGVSLQTTNLLRKVVD